MFFYKLISWKHHFAGSYICTVCQLPWQNRTIANVVLSTKPLHLLIINSVVITAVLMVLSLSMVREAVLWLLLVSIS